MFAVRENGPSKIDLPAISSASARAARRKPAVSHAAPHLARNGSAEPCRFREVQFDIPWNLDRLANRLTKIVTAARKLGTPQE